MLSQRGKEDIPVSIAGSRRLLHEQVEASPRRLPAELLQKLSDQPPPQVVLSTSQPDTKLRQCHRLVDRVTFLHGHDRNSPVTRRARGASPNNDVASRYDTGKNAQI
jgi:hypothetical protein